MKWNTRVLLLNTCTCAIIRKRVWRKKEEVVEEEEVEMQDEEGGVPKGGKWLVGEDDGTRGEGEGRGSGASEGGRRDHAALSSINLSAAVV